jgi:lipopolysaccharide/colanic/teichoic acid biosynthesis glycosyltransferase
VKRAFDVVAAGAGLLLSVPLLLLIAVLVRLTSRGPVLHRATRTGRDGAAFAMLKFRTMQVGGAGAAITPADDARVTSLGRVLRRTHADELPQLLNVLFGTMSLVGPRPEDPRLVDGHDPRWAEVLSVRPGLTGPTQRTFASLERELLRPGREEHDYRALVLPQKLGSDLEYVRTQTMGGDLACLVGTLLDPIARFARPGGGAVVAR